MRITFEHLSVLETLRNKLIFQNSVRKNKRANFGFVTWKNARPTQCAYKKCIFIVSIFIKSYININKVTVF